MKNYLLLIYIVILIICDLTYCKDESTLNEVKQVLNAKIINKNSQIRKNKIIKSSNNNNNNKLDEEWKKIINSKYTSEQINKSWKVCDGNNEKGHFLNKKKCIGGYPSGFTIAREAIISIMQKLKLTFTTISDKMPTKLLIKRHKFIHPLGAVAKIEYKPTNNGQNKYTGIFKTGALGFARIGWAAKPTVPPTENSHQPVAVAVKFFHGDKIATSNSMFMYSLDGQKSCNVLQEDLSNHLPIPKGGAVRAGSKLFIATTHTPTPNRVGIYRFAKYDNTGKLIEQPKYPYRLIIKAVSSQRKKVQDLMTKLGYKKDGKAPIAAYCDMRTQLSVIKPNEVLYKVYAVPPLDLSKITNKYASQCKLNHAAYDYQRRRFLDLDKTADTDSKLTKSFTAYKDLMKLEKLAENKAEEIGEIIVKSNFIGTEYGDKELFFQHQFFCPNEKIPSFFSRFGHAIKSMFSGHEDLSHLHGKSS